MAYLFTLYRQQGNVTHAELRAAVADLPFFHPQGASGYVCDIPQRRLWMEFTIESDGSLTIHIPRAVFEQNTRMVSDLCHSLATQLHASIFDHQLERDLGPSEVMTAVAAAGDVGADQAGPAWLVAGPLGTLISMLLAAAVLGLLALVGFLLLSIGSVAARP